MARAGNAARGDGRASGRAPTWRVGDGRNGGASGAACVGRTEQRRFPFSLYFLVFLLTSRLEKNKTENKKSECFSPSGGGGGGGGGGSFGSVQEARLAHPITWAFVSFTDQISMNRSLIKPPQLIDLGNSTQSSP